MANKIIVAAAGSGKTTTVVRAACSNAAHNSAMVTYTINGCSEIRRSTYREFGHIPPRVEVNTWYTFLLSHFIRPYQRCLEENRIAGLNFVSGRSALYVPEKNTRGHYFTRGRFIHSDKVSKFAYRVIELTDGAPLRRIERIFARLCLDECQDLAGYDLELIELLLQSNVQVLMVGDYRQATFSTHAPQKNKQFLGAKIVNKLTDWETRGLCELEHQNWSWRCIQPICDFADQFHPDAPNTVSKNSTTTDHDGIFAIRRRDITEYVARFSPQSLRYNRKTKCDSTSPINFGASKGMTFDRILIYPHLKLKKFLRTGELKDVGREREKVYVAVTRARQSVAFVVDDIGDVADGIAIYEP